MIRTRSVLTNRTDLKRAAVRKNTSPVERFFPLHLRTYTYAFAFLRIQRTSIHLHGEMRAHPVTLFSRAHAHYNADEV